MSTEPGPTPRGGLAGSIRRLASSAVGVIETRFEILSTEVGEERYNLTRIVIVVLAAQFCLQAGILLGVFFVVLTLGRNHLLAAIGVSALVLLLGAAFAAWWLMSWLKRRPPMFGTTIAELRKDRDRLTSFRREFDERR